jgi:hypothetical protein
MQPSFHLCLVQHAVNSFKQDGDSYEAGLSVLKGVSVSRHAAISAASVQQPCRQAWHCRSRRSGATAAVDFVSVAADVFWQCECTQQSVS